MEGMLIFAGLFSASLTAFLIESYKTLSPDSGDQTVKLLAQISQQLASGSNGTTFPISPAPTFTPSSTSLICNALWFISLGLSLTCALIATLLEQWARDFIHRSDMRSAPLIRARIYAYLYYGMRRFNMHAVVDIIPLLLHTSLLFFFAGLVVFLIPVNVIMTAIVAVLLVLVATTYSIITFLPLRYMDCPYRTPLSGAFWRLFQRLRVVWNRRLPHAEAAMDDTVVQADLPLDETMVELMARSATEDSPSRRERDYHALVWTVKSLADEVELEPFVGALPDVLWGPTGQRQIYCDHFRRLANDRDVQLCSRIDSLCASATVGILSPEAGKRRQISCHKALWAVASLAKPMSSQIHDSECPVDFHNLRAYPPRHPAYDGTDGPREVGHYAISAHALMQWSTFRAVEASLEEHEQYLVQRQAGSSYCREPPLTPTSSFLEFLARKCRFLGNCAEAVRWNFDLDPPEILKLVQSFRNTVPHSILFQYLCKSADLESRPYQWDETRATIRINKAIPFAAFEALLSWQLKDIADEELSLMGSQLSWRDTAMIELFSFWRPSEPALIPDGIFGYLGCRGSDEVVQHILTQSGIGDYAWRCVRPTLDRLDRTSVRTGPRARELARCLWALTCWTRNGSSGHRGFVGIPSTGWFHDSSIVKRECYTKVLKKAVSAGRTYTSTIAFMKMDILNDLYQEYVYDDSTQIAEKEWEALLRHEIFPPDMPQRSMRDLAEGWIVFQDRSQLWEDIMGAKLRVLTEFLEACSMPGRRLPYRAADTVEMITINARNREEIVWHSVGGDSVQIPVGYQLRFVASVHAVFAGVLPPWAAPRPKELLNAIVRLELLDGYAGLGIRDMITGPPPGYPWITDPMARQTLTEALRNYETTLAVDPDPPKDLLERLRAILEGLETLHPEKDPQVDDADFDSPEDDAGESG
ncbi:hypothetical protein DFH06DRAFT_1194726 [Mycena polygramma]|nr:hypothetical protein DFH06DRAFT_1194726 [Mycena polygramma]